MIIAMGGHASACERGGTFATCSKKSVFRECFDTICQRYRYRAANKYYIVLHLLLLIAAANNFKQNERTNEAETGSNVDDTHIRMKWMGKTGFEY